MNAKHAIRVIAAAIILCLAARVGADVPHVINYQGRLTDSLGAPLDTTVSIKFGLYDDSIPTTFLWKETHPSVTVTGGVFNVLLGTVNPLSPTVLNGDRRWLGVIVGTNPESDPLVPIVSVAYAYRALAADSAGHARRISDNAVTSDKIVDGAIQFENIGQNGAAESQIMKWTVSGWVAADDETGSGGESYWTATDSVLYTNNYWGLARGGADNILYGGGYSHTNLGVACTTGVDFEDKLYIKR